MKLRSNYGSHDAIKSLDIAAKAIARAIVEAKAGRVLGVERAIGKATANLNALRRACNDEQHAALTTPRPETAPCENCDGITCEECDGSGYDVVRRGKIEQQGGAER